MLFLSLVFIIAQYEIKNELIIFWNFGVNKIEFINFFIKFSILITILQIFLSASIVPKTQDLARSFLRTSSVNFLENFVKPKVFNDAIRQLTIYSNSKDKDGNLGEIYLKKGGSDNFQITYAKSGNFRKVGNSQILELYSGETISVIEDKITSFKFSKSENLSFNFVSYFTKDDFNFNFSDTKNQIIYIDTIYNPLETKTFKYLKEKGRRVFNGLDMFIYQGQKSFYLWNKINPEIDDELVELLNLKLK